jgi:thiol:disulfide interchange protein DsbA
MKLIRLIFVAWSLLFGALATASGFDEGIEYQKINPPVATQSGDRIEVLELFWYGCPHCFHLEPELKNWLENKPENVVFRRMPAVLGRGWAHHAKTFFALESLGELERVHDALFHEMHVKKNPLGDVDALAEFLAGQGVDADAFRKAFGSFMVDMQVRKASQESARYGIDGVPTLVVNGKYRTSPGLANGAKPMFTIIDELIRQESAPQAVAPATEQAAAE